MGIEKVWSIAKRKRMSGEVGIDGSNHEQERSESSAPRGRFGSGIEFCSGARGSAGRTGAGRGSAESAVVAAGSLIAETVETAGRSRKTKAVLQKTQLSSSRSD